MRKPAASIHIVLLALLALAPAPAALAEEGETATTTLKGEYWWSQRDSSGDLEAVFTPSGDGKWDVDFHFTFRGKDHTYSGTAEGRIGEGELSGEVKNESKERTFVFSGTFDGGEFKGTHAEIRGEGRTETGMLTLTAPGK